MNQSGTLYIVATPIGNLDDISYRAIKVLESVDFILCEDTRRSIKLLNHYNIKKQLISYHKFNETASVEHIISRLRSGDSGALISDAGTPLISDPGNILTESLIEQNIPFLVIPGANALLPALIYSGFKTDQFMFYGFLSKKKNLRKSELSQLSKQTIPVILYTAPHDLKAVLNDIYSEMPQRRLSLSKEISKVYEQTVRGKAEELLSLLPEEIKGEYVLVLDGNPDTILSETLTYSDDDLKLMYQKLLSEGQEPNEALKIIAKQSGNTKRDLYEKLRK